MKRTIDQKLAPSFTWKDFVFTPHPMQHRIDEFNKIPSLVTGGTLLERITREYQTNMDDNNQSTIG